MAIYINEFLYRGRAPDDEREPAWHLVLGSVGIDEFGKPFHDGKILTMAEAKAMDWDLPDIIREINADMLRENERLRLEVVQLTAELERKPPPEGWEAEAIAAQKHIVKLNDELAAARA